MYFLQMTYIHSNMLITKSLFRFSSIRVYNNFYSIESDRWAMGADLVTPTLQINEDSQLKLKYGGTKLMFSIIEKTKRFKKGCRHDYFPIKHSEMMLLAVWRYDLGSFQCSLKNKALVCSHKPQNLGISLTFLNNDLPAEDKRIEFVDTLANFKLFQSMLKSGMEDYTNIRRSSLSIIGGQLSKVSEEM